MSLLGSRYQRGEGVDEEQGSGQFSRPPVHERVGLDDERVGKVDDVQGLGVDRERGRGKRSLSSVL